MNISEDITRLMGAHVNITELAQLERHSDLNVKTVRTQARALQSPVCTPTSFLLQWQAKQMQIRKSKDCFGGRLMHDLDFARLLCIRSTCRFAAATPRIAVLALVNLLSLTLSS